MNDEPLDIVQYFPGIRLELGGVARAVLDWCSVLAARGNRMTLVTHGSPDVPGDWDGKDGRPTALHLAVEGSAQGLIHKAAMAQVREILNPGQVVHLHTPWESSNMQVAAEARKAGLPYVVSIHGMLDDWSMSQRRFKKRMFLYLAGGYLRKATAIHYTAGGERDQARKWLPGKREVILPPLIDLDAFQTLPGTQAARAKFPILERTDPKILFMSRLHEKKGVDVLLHAAALLRQAGREFVMLVAGTGEEQYRRMIERMVEELGLWDRVKLVGMVSGVEKISLLESADVFALPTHQENFGLALAEAMACGRAVVTTRGVDMWQEFESAGAVILERNDPKLLAAAIGRMLEDRDKLAETGARGREWVMRELDPKKVAGDYEGMYRSLAGK